MISVQNQNRFIISYVKSDKKIIICYYSVINYLISKIV
ncbi:hypothetical protein pb186bvf_005195 [Paramecium bursaria]